MEEYNHKEIEKKWQDNWKKNKTFETKDEVKGKENEFILVEFPYPSGNLHVGHWYAFAVTDIYAKYQRLLGKNVLFPMGFDSFGLPAENAAIKHNVDPKEWTYQNIETMKKQMVSMGTSFDWNRTFATSDPEYYKWTQWIFTKMFEKDLAYKKKATVNWDPVDKTVLANEQVLPDGTAERSGAIVEKKQIDQWFLKITDYAERLNDDLEELDWPEEIKSQQRNWIGKSYGSEIEFEISGTNEKIKVFTTRADTLFGATYMVIAPEHELIKKMSDQISNFDEVEKYVVAASNKKEIERTKVEKEKTGIELKGLKAINPANKKGIPIFVADYVLGSYGTGAVMAVPAHDERDYAFAKKYNLPIEYVICPHRIDKQNPPVDKKEKVKRQNIHAFVVNPKDNKMICLKWREHPWTTLIVGGVEDGEDDITAAKREIYEETGFKNLKFIKRVNSVPVIAEYYAAHKDHNKFVNTTGLIFELENDEKDEISDDENSKHEIIWCDFNVETLEKTINPCAELDIWLHGLNSDEHCYTEKGILINSGDFSDLHSDEVIEKITKAVDGKMKTTFKLRDWSVGRQRYWGTLVPIVYDPEGKPHPVPEEHLPWELPEDVDHKPTGEAPLAKSKELFKRTEEIFGKGWKPEVETLDTFIDSSWYFIRYADPNNEKQIANPEKVSKWLPVDFYSGGAEHTNLHLLYSRFFYKFLNDIGIVSEKEPYKKRLNRGLILGEDGNKMSKSRGNVVDPDEIVERLGSDTVRLYLAFIGPYNEPGSYPWDPNGVVGVRRFLERVWRISNKLSENSSEKITLEINKLIKKAREDYSELKFNTVIASMMSFVNYAEKENISKDDFIKFLIVLSASAPFVSEELFNKINENNSETIFEQSFPEFDEQIISTEGKKIGIQINGKVRSQITVSKTDSEENVKEKVLEIPEIKKWMDGKEVKKFIYIPEKIISIVV